MVSGLKTVSLEPYGFLLKLERGEARPSKAELRAPKSGNKPPLKEDFRESGELLLSRRLNVVIAEDYRVEPI